MTSCKEIIKNDDGIDIYLQDGTIIRVVADYSGTEDCADLVVFINGEEKFTVKDVFIGYTDGGYDRSIKRRK